MTTYSWKTATSGLWSTSSAWSPAGPPNSSSADAVIAVGGTYQVTLDSGGTYSVDTLRLAGSGATLVTYGTLSFSGTRSLTVSAGTLNVGGTIRGAVISKTGGSIVYSSGTLDAVTYRGTLDLGLASSTVYLRNGLTLQGSTGTGAGAIRLGSSTANSTIYVVSSSTLNNATITATNGLIYNYDTAGTGQTLTLGSSLVLQHGTGYVSLYAGSYATDKLVNQGRINVGTSGGTYLQIYGNSFSNTGTISISNGDTLLENATTFSNTGTIFVNAATLQLGGTLSSLSGISVSNAGVVRLTGLLNNAGKSISVGTGSALGTLALQGTITGGVINDAGRGLLGSSGTLDGVTYRGTLDLGAVSSTLYLRNKLTLQGAGGTGAGAIKIGSSTVNSSIYVLSSSTLTNATVTATSGLLYNYDQTGNGQTLTLGSSLVLQHGTGYASLYAGSYANDKLVNQGRINVGTSGGTYLQIYGNSFSNSGTISISNGDTLLENTTTFSNTGTIFVNAATLQLGGTLSSLAGISTSNAGVVRLTGLLSNSGKSFSIGTGSAIGTLALQGTITSGVINDTGRGLYANSGILDGVTYRGTLDLSAISSTLYLRNALTLQGAGGTGAGAIKIGSSTINSSIYTVSNITLNNATITATNGLLYNYDQTGNGQTLTLGSSLVLQHGTGYANIYAGNYTNDKLVNQGRINVGVSGGTYLQIYGNSFSNTGTISISNGDTLLENATTFSNTGTIFVNAATLQLGGTLSSLSGISVSNAGVVRLTGLMSNSGKSIAVGTGSKLGTLALQGTISGGVINDAGRGLFANSGTLDGVTYRGTLDLSAVSSTLYVRNTLTLQGAGGTGAGAIKIGSSTANSSIYVVSSSTLNNATITATSGLLYNYDTTGTGQTLTLGSSLVLQHGTGYASIYAGSYTTDRLINQGKIIASYSGDSYLQIYGNSFTNNGTISVSNGDTLLLNSTVFTNLSGTTLTGGSYQVGTNTTLQLKDNSTVSTLAANITLTGGGSVFQARNTTSGSQVKLESTLSTISSGGTLSLLGNRGYNTTKTLTDNGRIVLNGGTFTSGGTLTVGSGGVLLGYGTVKPTVASAGRVEASGGLLRLLGTVTGSGTLQIDNAATLELAAGSQAVNFATSATGTLKLDTASKFTGAIRGVTVGDSITFGNETVSSAVISGSTLTVTGTAGTTKYQVAGSLSGNHFAVQSDSHTIKLVANAALQLAKPAFVATSATAAPAAASTSWAATAEAPPVLLAASPALIDPVPSAGGLFAVVPTMSTPWLHLGHQ